jgi:hypothetical protein
MPTRLIVIYRWASCHNRKVGLLSFLFEGVITNEKANNAGHVDHRRLAGCSWM